MSIKSQRKLLGQRLRCIEHLGPGLLESAYEACLVYELNERGLKVEAQKPLPLVYKSVSLDCGYRLDLLVEDTVVVEIKSIDRITAYPSSPGDFLS